MNTEVEKVGQLSESAPREGTRAGRFYRPNVDIIERDNELLLLADMPGATPESLSVNYEKGIVSLHAKVEQRQDENMQFLLQEYGVADFYREFAINEHIDHERISAEYENGVLVVHLPKSEALKPKKIAVKAH